MWWFCTLQFSLIFHWFIIYDFFKFLPWNLTKPRKKLPIPPLPKIRGKFNLIWIFFYRSNFHEILYLAITFTVLSGKTTNFTFVKFYIINQSAIKKPENIFHEIILNIFMKIGRNSTPCGEKLDLFTLCLFKKFFFMRWKIKIIIWI